MASVEQKQNVAYQNCIKWIVGPPSSYRYAVVESDIFRLRNANCSISYERVGYGDGYGTAIIYLKIEALLNPPLKITAVITSEGPDTFAKNYVINRKKQEIWRKPTYEFLTVQVIILLDNAKEMKAKEDSKSYLENTVHFEALSRDFRKLLGDSSRCDVIISCDGKTFHAHKVVLETRSSVFAAMLKGNMVEGKTGSVNIEDINGSIFEYFLRYLYTGTLPELKMESAKKLYKVGDQYAVNEIRRACSEFLTRNLSVNNACELLILADLHSDKNFQKTIIDFIVVNKIPQLDKNWSDFCKQHCNLANEILNNYIKKYCPV